jgi:hypothetical protein
MKKFIKYFFLIVFFLLAAYFIYCLITNYSPERALPPEPQAVVSVTRPKKILYEYEFLLEEYPEIKNIKKFLPFIPNFNTTVVKLASGPVLIVDFGYYRGILDVFFLVKNWFLNEGNGIYLEENPVLRKEDPDSYILKNGRETLGFMARKRNLIIVSPFLKSFRTALANMGGDHPKPELNQSGDINIFFRTNRMLRELANLYPQIGFLKSVLEKNKYGTVEIYLEEDRIKMETNLRFSEPENYQEKVIARMLSQERGEPTIESIVPLRSSSFVSFTVENIADVYRYLVVLFKDYPELFSTLQTGNKALKFLADKDMNQLLFSWMGQEVATVALSDLANPIMVIQVKDADAFRKNFKDFIGDKVTRTGEHTVFRIELPGIFNFLKSIFAPSVQLPYFSMIRDRFLLIANSPKDIVHFLNRSPINVETSRDYKAVRESIDEGQVFFYADLSYGGIPLTELSPLLKKLFTRYYRVGGSVKFEYPKAKVNLVILKGK